MYLPVFTFDVDGLETLGHFSVKKITMLAVV